MNRRLARAAVLLGAILVAGMAAAQESLAAAQESLAAAQESLWSSLELEDLQGRKWGSAELSGRVVLIDFWATWCAPCLAEIPTLKKAYGEYHERGFEILGVSLDTGDPLALRSFIRRHGLAWPQIHQRRGFEGELVRRFEVESLPRSFLVDREGRVMAADLRGESLLAVLGVLFSNP